MGEHEEKIEIMRKYLADMTAAGNYHVKGNIPIKKIDNANPEIVCIVGDIMHYKHLHRGWIELQC